jgi:hypothetical protein
MEDCPFCKEPVNDGAIVCKTCFATKIKVRPSWWLIPAIGLFALGMYASWRLNSATASWFAADQTGNSFWAAGVFGLSCIAPLIVLKLTPVKWAWVRKF